MTEFENEFTWGKAISQNKTDEFDLKFDSAVDSIQNQFGKRYPDFINGEEFFSDEEFVVRCPSDTKIVLAKFPKLNEGMTKEAITFAKNAFPKWSSIPYTERAKIFRDVANVFSKKKFELAAWLCFENGKNRI
ncbi:MAG: aldehyde dehydrogenase family protein, partial [Nitrosopumilaceae archaeon]